MYILSPQKLKNFNSVRWFALAGQIPINPLLHLWRRLSYLRQCLLLLDEGRSEECGLYPHRWPSPFKIPVLFPNHQIAKPILKRLDSAHTGRSLSRKINTWHIQAYSISFSPYICGTWVSILITSWFTVRTYYHKYYSIILMWYICGMEKTDARWSSARRVHLITSTLVSMFQNCAKTRW